MNLSRLSLPLLFLLISSAHCEHVTQRFLAENYLLQCLFVFTFLLLTVIVRNILMSLECTIPYSAFMILLGVIWGVGALYSPWMATVIAMGETFIQKFQELVLPAIIFNTAFSLDFHAFGKSMGQLFIISFPICVTCACVIGMLMRQVLDTNWSVADGILLGVMICSIYPTDVIRYLKETSLDIKNVSNLLEGETVLTSITAVTLFKLVHYHIRGYVIHWYQYVMGLVRFICLGIPVGSFFGFLATFLMKLALNDINSLMLLTVAVCYVSYFIGEYFFASGIITNVMTALALGRERPSLCKENEEVLIDLWKLISFALVAVFLVVIGVMIPVHLNKVKVDMNEYFVVLVTYLMVNIARFVAFFLYSPILSRLGYGISFETMIICVWGGLKSPICINLVWKFMQYSDIPEKNQLFFLNISSVYVLMLLINASFLPVLFRAIGLADIPAPKQLNMSNCMKYIYETRARLIAVLKMDRLLSDANWPLVMNSTALKHPYRKIIQTEKSVEDDEDDDEDEQEDYLVEYGFTFCPDCHKNIPNEPTVKEMREMTREAKLRLLKHKKTAYSRQYENGMVSKEGVRILHQAVEIALDSDDLVIELDGLFAMFRKRTWFSQFMRNTLFSLSRSRAVDYKVPTKKYKKWCYVMVSKPCFVVFIHTIVVLNMATITMDFHVKKKDTTYEHLVPKLIFLVVYIVEFFIQLFAIHAAYWWKGFSVYLRINLNWLNFIVLLVYVFYSINYIICKANDTMWIDLWCIDLMMNFFLTLRLLRILIYFKVGVIMNKLLNALSRYWAIEADENRALAFEIGRSYITGEAHVLKYIHKLIDNDKLRDQLRDKTEADKTAVTRKLGLVQIESPWVTTRVKTRMAIRTVLNALRDEIMDLKVSGWVDDFEYNKLLKALTENYTNVQSIKMVERSQPKMIFREQSFMGKDEGFINFLYDNVCTRKFDPGNVVYQRGEVVEGIYILITGMFRVSYEPIKKVSEKLKEMGCLPVIEHFGGVVVCEKKSADYVTPGNSMGEMSTISGKPYDGYLTCEKHSEVFLLKRDLVKRAMEMDPDPIFGFECRIWKRILFHKTVAVLMNVPHYRSNTQLEVKYIMERSFIPNLSNYKVFVVNEMMQDIVLMQGIALDYNTREKFVAPCYIPRAVQKLILPSSSLMDLNTEVDTKLVIVPAKDYDEYEIMLTEEKSCELVRRTSSKCINHFIQEALHKPAAGSSKTSVTRSLKQRLMSKDVAKSKISFLPRDGHEKKV